MFRMEKGLSNPLQCYNCKKFKHHLHCCRRIQIYKLCGQDSFDHAEDSCRKNLVSDSWIWEVWKREKKVAKVMYTRIISFQEACMILATNFRTLSSAETDSNEYSISGFGDHVLDSTYANAAKVPASTPN